MVIVQSQSGLLVKRAEARAGNIRVRGRKPLFGKGAYSVLVEGRENTVMAGSLEQVTKMLMQKRLIKDAAGIVEAVSQAVRDDADLFSPRAVSGGISGGLPGIDIACLVAIKNGVNETAGIAEVFGIGQLKVHARLMSLRRQGFVCREEGTLLKYFLTERGLGTVDRGMQEEPFAEAKEWLSIRGKIGKAQASVPEKCY